MPLVFLICIYGLLFQLYAFNLDDNILARQFDGIGAMSNSGTSRLLIDYDQIYQDQILDYLFKPNFGASLHTLKVEIGSDTDTGCGSEHSHMHTSDYFDLHRGYEWWLMQEARKRNPNIRLGGLQFGGPAWIGNFQNGTNTPFSDQGIDYVIKWIQGAQTEYNLDILYIGGGWNERPYNTTYLKELRKALDNNGFNNYYLICCDEWGSGKQWDIVNDMNSDPELMKIVDIIGVHQNGPLQSTPGTNDHGVTPQTAVDLGKPLWQSEEHIGLPDGSPTACWDWAGGTTVAIEINQNYLRSNLTSTLIWAATYSWYQGLVWWGKGLLQANTPWSGFYSIDYPLWSVAHTTQFTLPGWIYLGGEGSALLEQYNISYVTYIPPKSSSSSSTSSSHRNKDFERNTVEFATEGDFTLVIESFLANASQVPYPMNFSLQGGLKIWAGKTLSIWATLGPDIIFQKQKDIIVSSTGEFSIDIPPGVCYTITTTTGQMKGQYPLPPKPLPFPFPYSENFDSYVKNDTFPKYFSDMEGAFSISIINGNGVLRQQAINKPVTWASSDVGQFLELIGSPYWTDVTVTVSILLEQNPSPVDNNYFIALGVRMGVPGININNLTAPKNLYSSNPEGYVWKITQTTYEVRSGSITLINGTLSTILQFNTWYKLSFSVKGMTPTLIGFIEGKQLFTCLDGSGNRTTGYVSLGSGLHHAQFDNFVVE